MRNELAICGGRPVIETPKPHFRWPPHIPGLAEEIARYVESGEPLSIVGRSGVFRTLEEKMCALHGRRYGIVTSSGTMALYSAYFGLDLQPGDEVISTVYSFHATSTPLLHLGIRVVFCDVEPDTGNIDAAEIEALITPRTRAIVTNHMWGHPVDIDNVLGVCRKHGIAWVEDCSHAHFSEYKGRYVGSFGDVAVFSLQGNKLLTGGEGGILLTDSTEVYERATLLGHSLKRSEECVNDPRWQDIRRTGFGLKLRMHPLAAVMVLYLLENTCFDWIASRAETLKRFSTGLEATGRVQPMARRDTVTSMGAHYGFKPRIDFGALGVTREKLIAALQAEGVDADVPGSEPFHHLPLFDSKRFLIANFPKADNTNRRFPGADTYYNSILSLPTFTSRTEWPMVDLYVEAFHKVLSELEKLM